MRQYPETIATNQDVLNILNDHPEYHTKLRKDLQQAYDEIDEATQVILYDIDPVTGEMINIKTKKVKKEKMKLKDIGFKDKTELKKVIDQLLI